MSASISSEELCGQRPKGWTEEAACCLPVAHNSAHQNAAGDLTWEPLYVSDMRRENETLTEWVVTLRDLLTEIDSGWHSEIIDYAREQVAGWEEKHR